MDIKVLRDLGFTEGEIKVYLALIEFGESTIGPISKKANITSAKTYPILEKLIQKGLITYVIKSGTKYFQVLNPNRILNFLDEKEKNLKEQRKEIKELIPKLEFQKKQEQYATVYESFNGIKTLYNEILEYLSKNKENFIGFTLGEGYEKQEVNIFFKNYDRKRKELGIKTLLIGPLEQKEFIDKNYKKDNNIEIRYVKQAVPTGVIIWGDNVATLLWHDIPSAFVIHSKQNAEVYKKFFWEFWKISKK